MKEQIEVLTGMLKNKTLGKKKKNEILDKLVAKVSKNRMTEGMDVVIGLGMPLKIEILVRRFVRKLKQKVNSNKLVRIMMGEKPKDKFENRTQKPIFGVGELGDIREDFLKNHKARLCEVRAQKMAPSMISKKFILSKEEKKEILIKTNQDYLTKVRKKAVETLTKRRLNSYNSEGRLVEAREKLADEILGFVLQDYNSDVNKPLFIDTDCKSKELGGLMKRHKNTLQQMEMNISSKFERQPKTIISKIGSGGSNRSSPKNTYLPNLDDKIDKPNNFRNLVNQIKSIDVPYIYDAPECQHSYEHRLDNLYAISNVIKNMKDTVDSYDFSSNEYNILYTYLDEKYKSVHSLIVSYNNSIIHKYHS